MTDEFAALFAARAVAKISDPVEMIPTFDDDEDDQPERLGRRGEAGEEQQLQENKRFSASLGKEDKGNQKNAEIESEDIGKDGSDMETDESDGEESWKEEEVGEEEGGAEEVSNQNSPTHSMSIGIVNSQPLEEKDNVNEEKEMEIEQEKDKETE
ncbi:uncharacterized protein LOC131858516 [Cryptomeria japonica]|uniref:uncharacterized protein LOC131858516 n=1 Tax=Cryptomeria japonica TaxID=3369 RepID=UPI0027D9D22C|nr:uncharacterized protein LOC131858516 [Cryptomeria japonica]